MRLFKPSSDARPKDAWSVARLWFIPDRGELAAVLTTFNLQRLTVLGSLDLASGRWASVPSPHGLSEYDLFNYHLCGLPCSPDVRRVVWCSTKLSDDTIETCVGEPQHLNSPLRVIESGKELDRVTGFAFSADGRWLFGVERWWEGGAMRGAIARCDIDALCAKPVLEKQGRNPLTGEFGIERTARPGRWKRIGVLPADVSVCELVLSPDGRTVAVGSCDGDTHMIRASDGKPQGIFRRQQRKRRNGSVTRIAFAPEQQAMAIIADGILSVWALKANTRLWKAGEDRKLIRDVAFSPTGRLVGFVRSDGSAAFADAATGAIRNLYSWRLGPLQSFAFSPDGLLAAAGGENGQVVVWDVDG